MDDGDYGRRNFMKGAAGVAGLGAFGSAGFFVPPGNGPAVENVPNNAARGLPDYVGRTLSELEAELPEQYQVEGILYQQKGPFRENGHTTLQYEPVNVEDGLGINYIAGDQEKVIADFLAPLVRNGSEIGHVRDFAPFDIFGWETQIVDYNKEADGRAEEYRVAGDA